MDLRWSAVDLEFRDEAREWLAANLPKGLPSGDTPDGFAQNLEWERQLFKAGWAAVGWPSSYGGRDASLWQWLLFEEEYFRAGAPQRVNQNGIYLLAPSLFAFGTQHQKDVLLPRIAAATDLWAQGWSEPGSGSDLASLRSTARRTDSGWVLNGQKTWTTRGAYCTHLFGLFRTGAAGSRHRGLTYFLVPLTAPGVRVRGFARLDGDQGFAEVFFDDVEIPEDAVLGEVDGGWEVAMATTGSERGISLRSPGRFLSAADRLVELVRSRQASPESVRAVAHAWMRSRAYRDFSYQEATKVIKGSSVGARSSLSKLMWSELDLDLTQAARDVLGTESQLDDQWSRAFMFSLAGPIYAGTNEIQRNIVAERLLGLPRGQS